jgi:porphobilinogen synthase
VQFSRLRRLRKNKPLRQWFSQTRLDIKDFILPYFVVEGKNLKVPIKSMPGIYHLSIDNLLKDIAGAREKGIPAILLFGITGHKDNKASSAYKKDGIVQKATRAIKKEFKDLMIITDVCLCGYTLHGHCGVVKNNIIGNDATLKILAKIALSHAEAGVDFVAPSAMMDGQVKAIRQILDKNGFIQRSMRQISTAHLEKH